MARTKICIICKKEKVRDDFYIDKSHKDGLGSSCKVCRKLQAKKRHMSKEGSKLIRESKLKDKYGINLDDYDKMFEAQNGVCAICGKPETKKTVTGVFYRLSVDHHHLTGQVRGLLCKRHNTAIGQFDVDENLDMLKSALKYLEKYQ